MKFIELKNIIKEKSRNENFQTASDAIQNMVFNLSKKDFIPLVVDIGAIPEDIIHDSTEEKLFAKVSDIILAKCFIELGLKSSVLKERANCADVIVKSKYHDYSLVADAKSFRLSRTAKNQKDFKVESMVHWKGDSDYSVLCCPYFQYPKNKSQIYGQAISGNVSLFSWEYFDILLNSDIQETQDFNLSELWNFSNKLSLETSVNNMNLCFLQKQNKFIEKFLSYNDKIFNLKFDSFRKNIVERAKFEVEYWQKEMEAIGKLSHEEAISLLIKSLKLKEKINSINSYIVQLECKNEN